MRTGRKSGSPCSRILKGGLWRSSRRSPPIHPRMAAFFIEGADAMRQIALAMSLAGLFSVPGHAADIGFTYLVPPKGDARPAAPFSNGVMVGETLYVAGNIGIDAATGQ